MQFWQKLGMFEEKGMEEGEGAERCEQLHPAPLISTGHSGHGQGMANILIRVS